MELHILEERTSEEPRESPPLPSLAPRDHRAEPELLLSPEAPGVSVKEDVKDMLRGHRPPPIQIDDFEGSVTSAHDERNAVDLDCSLREDSKGALRGPPPLIEVDDLGGSVTSAHDKRNAFELDC